MTIAVEVPDQKAMALPKQLEELNVLKLLNPVNAQPEMVEVGNEKEKNS